MAATLTFSDDFNNLSLYSSTTGHGTWDTTYWWADGVNSKGNTLTGNNEQEWYINADYAPTSSVKPWTVNNGVLNLQAAPASADISAQINGYKYTSGMLDTYHSFKQTYGYFEMRADLPAGKGLWPAFWLLPADGSWPPELDVMEVLGQDPTKLYTTVHSTTLPGGMQSINGGTKVADMSSGYHTYAVDWEPDHITWYFDNKQIYQVATPSDMNKPMYLLANLAVGGSWPGSPDASTQFPANMQIDYIKAWSANPYADGTATPTAPSAPTTGSTGSTGSAGSGGGSTSTPAAAPADDHTVDGTSANDSLTGPDGQTNHIHGQDGADSIVGGTGFNDVNGNKGDDTIVGHSQVGDWLLGGQGNDSISVQSGGAHNLLHGNLGSDTITAGAGGDTLRGGQGDDHVIGGAGKDWLAGDKGTDVVTGGGGADTFHGAPGMGVTTITDFHQSEGDHVQLDHGTQYTATQSGADVHVDLTGGGQIILQNTQLTSLTSGWLVVS